MADALRAATRYLRVSKTDQDPALQDDETAELITSRGWKLTDTYTDHGVSGSRRNALSLTACFVMFVAVGSTWWSSGKRTASS
jgi:hypothetical protein